MRWLQQIWLGMTLKGYVWGFMTFNNALQGRVHVFRLHCMDTGLSCFRWCHELHCTAGQLVALLLPCVGKTMFPTSSVGTTKGLMARMNPHFVMWCLVLLVLQRLMGWICLENPPPTPTWPGGGFGRVFMPSQSCSCSCFPCVTDNQWLT